MSIHVISVLLLYFSAVHGSLPSKKDNVIDLNLMRSMIQGYEAMGEELGQVKARMASIEVQNLKLKEANQKLAEKIEKLEYKEQFTHHTRESQVSVQKEYDSTNSSTGPNKSSVQNQQSNTDYNEMRISRQVPADVRVAFSASVSIADIKQLGVHHTIVFNHVFLNHGNGYHPNTGVFMVPVKGVYFFVVTLVVKPGKLMQLEIVVDGKAITHMYAGAIGVNDFISSGRHMMVEINQGSEVWVRTYNAGELHGNGNTEFSGFLLYETE